MRKTVLVLSLILAIASRGYAQFTNVTGTIIDPNGMPYGGATIKAQLTNPAATVTVNNAGQCASAGAGAAPCQLPIQGNAGPFTVQPNGSFSFTLFDNAQIRPVSTQWIFSVSTGGIAVPAGTGPQSCTATLTITGANQDISSNLSCPSQVQIVNPSRVFNGSGPASNAAVGPFTMLTVPAQPAAGTRYVFSPYVTQTVLGVTCAGNSTVTVNAIFQDPNAAAPQTQASQLFLVTGVGTLGIVPSVSPGVGVGVLASGTFLAKAGSIVQWSASAPTGGGCTTVPTVQVFALLELQ